MSEIYIDYSNSNSVVSGTSKADYIHSEFMFEDGEIM